MRLKQILLLVALGAIVWGVGCTKGDMRLIAKGKRIVLNHNYMAIRAQDGSAVQVRLRYSVYDTYQGVNRVKDTTCETPCLVGGEPVQVLYDSMGYWFGSIYNMRYQHSYRKRYMEYAPREADYWEVENLSTTPLEYCIVGNEPFEFRTSFDSKSSPGEKFGPVLPPYVVNHNPSPIYRKAPMLYLLMPDLAPQRDYLVFTDDESEALQSVPLRRGQMGDVKEGLPLSIDSAMALYRADFTGKGKKVLYIDFSTSTTSYEIEAIASYHYRPMYGTIRGSETVRNQGDLFVVATYWGKRVDLSVAREF